MTKTKASRIYYKHDETNTTSHIYHKHNVNDKILHIK